MTILNRKPKNIKYFIGIYFIYMHSSMGLDYCFFRRPEYRCIESCEADPSHSNFSLSRILEKPSSRSICSFEYTAKKCLGYTYIAVINYVYIWGKRNECKYKIKLNNEPLNRFWDIIFSVQICKLIHMRIGDPLVLLS